MDKIKKMTQYQIRSAEYELERIQREKYKLLSKSIPDFSYEENEKWRLRHPSPSKKREIKIDKLINPLKIKFKKIIFSAKMGEISAAEMMDIVEKIRKEELEVGN